MRFARQIAIVAVLMFIVQLPMPMGRQTIVEEATAAPARDAKLDMVMLFHLNQAAVPYGDVADELCYYQVIQTLRAHPNLNFTLHISGTLISDLLWFDNATLRMIIEGVRAGQFELVGSTYSQAVMYSCDDYDNRVSVALHNEQIKEYFGVNPSGFWNAERCWNQSRLLPVIADAGYSYTFVEDKILSRSAGYSGIEHCVRKTSYEGKQLYIFNDDRDSIAYDSTKDDGYIDRIPLRSDSNTKYGSVTDRINYALSTLQGFYNSDSADEACVVYAQDCEAWGLWQEEGGSNGADADSVEEVTARLDALLTRLETTSWLKLTTPSKFIAEMNARSYSYRTLSSIPDGGAAWMDANAKNAGYADWITWQSGSALSSYRTSFTTARQKLANADSAVSTAKLAAKNTTAAERLLKVAKLQYISCQFEFGCWGCLFKWYYQSKCSGIAVEACMKALEPPTSMGARSADLDSDGSIEYILESPTTMAVFAAQGGRLIALFDLVNGTSLLYNDAPSTYTAKCPDYSYSPLCSCSEMISGSDLWGRTSKTYWLRHKCFADYADGSFIANSIYTTNIQSSPPKITFAYSSGKSITKEATFATQDAISIAYSYSGISQISTEMSFSNGLDYLIPERANAKVVTDKGNYSLSYSSSTCSLPAGLKEVGMHDTRTGAVVKISSDVPLSANANAHVFALSFKCTPSSGSSMKFTLSYYNAGRGSDAVVVTPMPVVWTEPSEPRKGDNVTIFYNPKEGALPDGSSSCKMHWGCNGWKTPPADAWPAGSTASGLAVDTPMTLVNGNFSATIQTDFRISSLDLAFTDGTNWDNNGSNDYMIALKPSLDSAPPSISNINCTLRSQGVCITFRTNESALCAIEYGTSSSYTSSKNGTSFASLHEFIIPIGLEDTLYYRIVARDRAGNQKYSPSEAYSIDQSGKPKFIKVSVTYEGQTAVVKWMTDRAVRARLGFVSLNYSFFELSKTGEARISELPPGRHSGKLVVTDANGAENSTDVVVAIPQSSALSSESAMLAGLGLIAILLIVCSCILILKRNAK